MIRISNGYVKKKYLLYNFNIFSILNKRQFKVYLTNESRIKKVRALLKELGINNREIDSNFKFDLKKQNNEIDYKSAYETINVKRKASKEFLHNTIKGGAN